MSFFKDSSVHIHDEVHCYEVNQITVQIFSVHTHIYTGQHSLHYNVANFSLFLCANAGYYRA